MAMTNKERVGKGLDVLAEGLRGPVDKVMSAKFGTPDWDKAWQREQFMRNGSTLQIGKDDVAVMLRAITDFGKLFNGILTRPQQAYASELRETRNQWAHSTTMSSDDALRALNTMELLLKALGDDEHAGEVRKLWETLRRTVDSGEVRAAQSTKAFQLGPEQGLKPWREVIKPHKEVLNGTLAASQFAANLYDVAVSKEAAKPGNDYGDPRMFFDRTYLTEGLKDLLSRAVRRIVGDGGGSPVVNLQTNFGGGKTHSLLALYHLFGDLELRYLSGEVQELVKQVEAPQWHPGDVARVALVGTALNASKPVVKPDGTQVHTIWGELAWQLGGAEAYEMVRANDLDGTNPGYIVRDLLAKYGPALILIDEWAAYAQQLVGRDDLPAGTFENQFAFAQTLTEAVSASPHSMLVVSVPAGESGKAHDSETGGDNGRIAIERLQKVVGRTADQWRPSSRDESFEIVRKRLFEEPDAENLKSIAVTAAQFLAMYRKAPGAFPTDAGKEEYAQRIRSSYPLHPELLDRLYEDWSTLENFQRTRGVLTLVSALIRALWKSNDANPLILPGNVPLETAEVNSQFTQYLADGWKPVIEADVAGPDSSAALVDLAKPAFGSRHLAQRVARTIFLDSAPLTGLATKGVDGKSTWLGTAMPADIPGNFIPALEALKEKSTYFLNEDGRFRYSLQPSLQKTAKDYADRLRDDPARVDREIVDRLQRESQRGRSGLFRRVTIAPEQSSDVADADEATLVIMHPRYTVERRGLADSAGMAWAQEAIQTRGTAQRVNRNMLLFLAAETTAMESVQSAARQYLAWQRIVDQQMELNLTAQQVEQAKANAQRHERSLEERLAKAYGTCLVPVQQPGSVVTLEAERIGEGGGDASMAQRASTKLRASELLIENIDSGMLWLDVCGNLASAFSHGAISAGAVWDAIARFPYMPRLVSRAVLEDSLHGLEDSVPTADERFALAAGRDDATGRFRQLAVPGETDVPTATMAITDGTLLVQWDAAMAQVEADRQAQEEAKRKTPENPSGNDSGESQAENAGDCGTQPPAAEPQAPAPIRYFATVDLGDGIDNKLLNKINEQVLDQLRFGNGSVRLTLEIESSAKDAQGFSDATQKQVEDGSRKLGFAQFGFEDD